MAEPLRLLLALLGSAIGKSDPLLLMQYGLGSVAIAGFLSWIVLVAVGRTG